MNRKNLNYINYNNNYSEIKFIQQIKEIYNLSRITKYNPIYKLFKKKYSNGSFNNKYTVSKIIDSGNF